MSVNSSVTTYLHITSVGRLCPKTIMWQPFLYFATHYVNSLWLSLCVRACVSACVCVCVCVCQVKSTFSSLRITWYKMCIHVRWVFTGPQDLLSIRVTAKISPNPKTRHLSSLTTPWSRNKKSTPSGDAHSKRESSCVFMYWKSPLS